MERTGAVTRGRDPKLEAKSSYGLLRYDSFALPPYLYYSKPLQELEALRTIIPTPTQTTGPEETPGTGASKKKKKKSSKKAALDLEAFEKELNESKAKEADDDDGGEEQQVLEVDETELGDDPFARGGGEGDESGEPSR